jgi:hypothetical protein
MTTTWFLEDLTFLIPVRLDSVQRIENLQMTIEHLLAHFDTNIYVQETGDYNNGLLMKLLPVGIKYRFVEDYDPIFHRTYYINRMIEQCATPLVAVWDSDVITPANQIIEAVEWLRTGEADFVRPYDKQFLDTSLIIRELYFKTRDISCLQKHSGKMISLYPPYPVGGGFFANLEKYKESGLENEKFYGWGVEDGERVNRWNILGYKYKNTLGITYHLSHPRGQNSQFHCPQEMDVKNAELYRIASMSKKELQKEIAGWRR